MSNAAHQLRTPVAALLLKIEDALLDHINDPISALLADLEHDLQRLSRLLNQLLTLERENQLVDDRNVEVVCIAKLVRRLIGNRLTLADQKRIDISLDIPEALSINGNKFLLEQIIANGLDNAIQHCPEGCSVVIRARYSHANFIIEVLDNGPGIPRGKREEAFIPFKRFTEYGESIGGLGLAIVKTAADRLGGCVELLDNEDGRGLCMRYTHPIR